MKHFKFILSVLAILTLVAGSLVFSSCNEAGAGYDEFASQISSAPSTAPTGDDVPSYVLPKDLTGEAEVLAAAVDFAKSEEHDLGRYKLATANGTLTVFTADGMKAASFKLDGKKMVPTGTQPMDNKALPVYSGPPGDNYSNFHIYPSSHETGDGMTPFFAVDHNGGQVTITPGEDLSINRRESRGHRSNTGGGGDCSTGGGG